MVLVFVGALGPRPDGKSESLDTIDHDSERGT